MGGCRSAEKHGKRAAGAGAGVVKEEEAVWVMQDEGRGSQCPDCGKIFNGRNHKQVVERHRIIHTGEKPFQCPLCYKRMNQKHHLTRHLRTVHLDQWDYIKKRRLV